MTRRLVIDANVALTQLLGEPLAPRVTVLLDQSKPIAPWLWRLEVINTLLVQERRRTLSRTDVDRLIGLVDRMPVELVAEPADRSAVALAAVCRPYQLTTYDAIYLELADRLSLPLFTLDKNLIAAAERVGVELVTVA